MGKDGVDGSLIEDGYRVVSVEKLREMFKKGETQREKT
jgi:hypothetical protein